MGQLFAIEWVNPDKAVSGAMHNVREKHLQDSIDRAWGQAGENGQVSFGRETVDASEYAF